MYQTLPPLFQPYCHRTTITSYLNHCGHLFIDLLAFTPDSLQIFFTQQLEWSLQDVNWIILLLCFKNLQRFPIAPRKLCILLKITFKLLCALPSFDIRTLIYSHLSLTYYTKRPTPQIFCFLQTKLSPVSLFSPSCCFWLKCFSPLWWFPLIQIVSTYDSTSYKRLSWESKLK